MPIYDLVDLGPPIAQNGAGTYVSDLNEQGRTAGVSYYYSTPDPSLDEREEIATVWDEDGAGTLLESPGNRSKATGINDKGSVVGTWGMVTGSDADMYSKHAFVYRDGSMVDDFLIEQSGRVVNVLNAPSPAATSALKIGESIVNQLAAA